MPTFDGVNLIMTLDAVASQDLINDWYEPWKDWLKLPGQRNTRFPQLFLSEGGAPVNATLNQGSYIRINNSAGWRIRPPEQDIEILYTGNLVRTDDSLPIFIPTVGAFTAAVFNAQPITTQSVITTGSGLSAAQDASLTFIEDQLTSIHNGWNLDSVLRLVLGVNCGKISGPPPGQAGTVIIRDPGDTKNVMEMPVDANGYRIGPAVYDPTP